MDWVSGVRPEWLAEIRANAVIAEARRPLARYDTGTISEAACLYLRAVTAQLKPQVAIEIGTFIGSSTMAIEAKRIYTCDKSNDCMQSTKRIVTHPYTGSTRMLDMLLKRGVSADFFFIDGRLKDRDIARIRALSKPSTVYAFDDYEGREKGVINVEKMIPHLPMYRLVPPPARVLDLPSTTTIAMLVP